MTIIPSICECVSPVRERQSNREAVGAEGENEHGFHSLSLHAHTCTKKREDVGGCRL